MVSVLTSPTLLQNSTFVVVVKIKTDIKWCPVLSSPPLLAEYFFCSCSEKQNGHQMVPVLTSPIIAEFYFCSCSENQNGHQMVPVLSSPPLLQNSTFVVVV